MSNHTAMTFLDQSYAWRPGTHSRYDSLWALFHKLIYLNGVRYRDIATDFFESKHQAVPPTRSLLTVSPYTLHRLAKVLEHSAKDLNAYAIPYSIDYSEPQNVAEHLRYCPRCMQTGFHSVVFQNRSIVRCPLHGEILQTHCPECHNLISYELSSKALSVPFGCVCGHVLWSGVFNDDWPRSIQKQDEHTFEIYHNWATRFEAGEWLLEEMSTRAIYSVEPIHGWDPSIWRKPASHVIESVFNRDMNSRTKPSSPPVRIASMATHPGSWVEVEAYTRFLFPIYRKQANKVIATLRNLIGHHLDCVKTVIVKDGFVGHYDEDDKECLWGVAYKSWYQACIFDTEESYHKYSSLYYNDPVYCYWRALKIFDGADAKPYLNDDPQFLWLFKKLQYFELLHDFGRHLERYLCLSKHARLHEHELFTDKAYLRWPPLVAYYPGTKNASPKIRACIGISPARLRTLIAAGVGCDYITTECDLDR